MIFATGFDSDLREMCWTLLKEGLASQCDMFDRSRLYLKNGDTPKFRSSGMAVTIVCKRADLEQVMKRMRASYHGGDSLAAYALPILASM